MSSTDIIQYSNHHRTGKAKRITIKVRAKLSVIATEGRYKSKALNIISFLFSSEGLRYFKKFSFRFFQLITGVDLEKTDQKISYNKWKKKNPVVVTASDIALPVSIGIVINLDAGIAELLPRTVLSLQKQSYKNIGLYLYSKYPIPPSILTTLSTTSYNLHLAGQPKVCFSEDLTEDFVGLIDCGDEYADNGLARFAQELNQNPTCEVIYADEDSINEKGQFSNPYLKPDWSPHNLYSHNYLGKACLVKRTILDSTPQSPSVSLLLLNTLQENSKVAHIPTVLFSSIAGAKVRKSITQEEITAALENKLAKQAYTGQVSFPTSDAERYTVFIAPKETPKVSIIIPTKDRPGLVKQCIDSILEYSTYKNIEIIVIDNNSEEEAFFRLIENYKQKYPSLVKCYREEIPFNFSLLVNSGVRHAEGTYVLLLNNDTKVITPDWIERMIGYAQKEEVGVVGVKLLYPDQSIQHAGVALGIGGVASHVFLYEERCSPLYHHYINSTINYSALTAACIMVSKEKYQQVDGFDPVFVSDYNDIDFCLKLREKKYYNLYLPQVELFHYESISRGRSNSNTAAYQRYLQETAIFKKKWDAVIQQDPFYNKNLSRRSLYFELA
jgi:GT2 family glycosyltransferase